MTDDVFHAGLAYFWTGNAKFAEMGVRRVRDWFVNNETAVTPHLMYADWVKGAPDPYLPDGSVIPGMNVETGGIIGKYDVTGPITCLQQRVTYQAIHTQNLTTSQTCRECT